MKIKYFSDIRIFSCISIVLLHIVTSASIIQKDAISLNDYSISMAIVYSLFFAVPCFVMVTGALLLGKEGESYNLKKIFSYIRRIVVTLVIAITIFRIFSALMDEETINGSTFIDIIRQIFTGGSWSHLWYLYLIVGIYLLLPVYKLVADHAGSQTMIYLLVVYFIFLSVVPLMKNWGVTGGFYIHVSTIYPFYLFLGFALSKSYVSLNRMTSVFLVVLGTALTFVAVYCRYKYQLDFLDSFLSYSSPFVVIQSIGIFSLFKSLEKQKNISSVEASFDNCSLGIYILHMIPVRIFLRYMGINLYSYGIFAFLAIWIGIVLITWVVVFMIKKLIPVIF